MGSKQPQQQVTGIARRRWRNYLINPGFQWKFAGLLMLTVFCVSSFITVVVSGALLQSSRTRMLALMQNPGAPPATDNVTVVVGAALAMATVAAVAVGLWTIVFTHRISGPIFVLERWISELAEGRLPTLRPLRKKDEFKQFHDAFARAVDGLRERKQDELTRLTEAASRARAAASGDHEDPRQALEAIAAQIDGVREEIAETLGESLDNEPPASTTDCESNVASFAPVGA